jgi:hypothetical protein
MHRTATAFRTENRSPQVILQRFHGSIPGIEVSLWRLKRF